MTPIFFREVFAYFVLESTNKENPATPTVVGFSLCLQGFAGRSLML